MAAKDFVKQAKEKISSSMSKLGTHINEKFAQIIKIIAIVGVAALFVCVIIAFMVSKGRYEPEVTIKPTQTKTTGQREVDFNLLMNNEIILPTNTTFDLSCDYVDFMTIKEYTPPQIDMVIKDYQVILEDAIDSELQFGFELRGKNGKKTK